MKLVIIIPVYNAAKTVGETLASLQAIEDGWEHVDQVVICDDASNDNSIEVIRQTHFDRCSLRIVRHEHNRGESATYTTMLASLPEGIEWFLILHSDDLALPNFLFRNQEILGQCDDTVASVSSNHWVFDENSEELSSAERDVVLFNGGTKENIRFTASVGCWWHISGALVNLAKWMELGGRDPKLPYSGDWDLVLRWQLRGYTVGHSAVATTKYRQASGTSISGSWYMTCRDLREQTSVAMGLPEVFYGKTKRVFAIRMIKTAFRRSLKFLLSFKPRLSMIAFKVGLSSLNLLLNSRVKGG
jgi:glycosyltransferase involved in cell wall biosynthesis